MNQFRLQFLQASFRLLSLGKIANKAGEIALVTGFHFANR